MGKLTNPPITDYIKLDISGVAELSDEIGICWFKDKGWQIVNDESKIIEVKIDTTKYIIKTNWPEDERKIPTASYYKTENCYTIGALNYSEVHPVDNGYVERR